MEVMESITTPDDKKLNRYSAACCLIASVISILLGYDTGVMSGATLFIKQDLHITDTQIEILNGILNLCALVGSTVAGKTSDVIGRRYTIVLASVIFFTGALLMGLSDSYAILMTGRCVAGVGVGFALMIAPVYSAEISSASNRGSLTSLPEVCISFGILLGYISNYGFSKLPLKYGWRVMLGLGSIPAIGLALGIVLTMPESPRWLVMHGKIRAARSVLQKISDSPDESDVRLREIMLAAGFNEQDSLDHDQPNVSLKSKDNSKGVLKELLLKPSPAIRSILLAALGIHFFEHVTGIEAVVLYSPRIFMKSGIVSKSKLLLATMGVGVTKIVFILIATFNLDRVGRRPLLLSSVAGMVVSLCGLGMALTVVDNSNERVPWAVIASISFVMSYVAFFSIGLGPITWVYSSEIFPSRLRAQGMGLAVAMNRVMNATVSMSFVSLYQAITIGGSFFLFAGIGVLAWLFFYFFLPETKGRSLEEMEELFTKRDRGSGPLKLVNKVQL